MDMYGSSDEEDYYSEADCEDDHYSQEAELDDSLTTDKRSTCKVIKKETLLAAQKEDLRKIMELLTLTEQHARTLLIYHRWDVTNLLSVLVEKGKDQLFLEAGVTMLDRTNFASPCSSSPLTECNICMEDVPSEDITTMDCGHFFCNNCWTEHFKVKINEGQSRRIRCMVHKCNTICDEAVVRNLVSTRDCGLAERFDRFLLESYIEDNKMVKWCPSVPHCGNAIRAEDDIYCEVECSCGLQFCFGCLSNVHSPCACDMWSKWSKKCADESETLNWIGAHTKPCPKCAKPVEKNGGCNLVTCLCGQAFCWLCGGATGQRHTWSRIEGHSCGRFKDEEEKKAELAKKYHYRYMHYYTRYKAHMDSLKLETKLEATIQDKVTDLENKECYRDCSWLIKGHHRLFRSRRVLAYSYPFAYYAFDDEHFTYMTKAEKKLKQDLFEDQQQQFEANVEKLSMYLEAPMEFGNSEEKFMETRMQIISLATATDSMCKSMYDCIENDLQVDNIAPYRSDGVQKAIELPNL